uniref:EF-hand domain-containing protein n=1 Tax=uncultured marine group II/III euryarchaeote AD1000_24_F05 TaxID=1457742 RepID=A0A075FMD3_9EURY|nr:hypothetical protein [uncultured marine group II/III euryarchaeote AD1000_24_F05]
MKVNLIPAQNMSDEELLRHAKIRYPNIAFKRGDKPKSFFFNIVYSLIWLALVLAVSAAGYLFVSPYCGFGAILSLLMLKGLLDVLMGNTVLVADGESLVFRNTKEKTKRDLLMQKKMIQKLSVLDKDEVDQKLDSLISEILTDYGENNQEKAFAIASLFNMDKNKDGQLSEAEMWDTGYDDILSSFGLEENENLMKENENLAKQILLYLDSNPNATSKNIVEMFSNGSSKEDKYDPFS